MKNVLEFGSFGTNIEFLAFNFVVVKRIFELIAQGSENRLEGLHLKSIYVQ